MATDARQTAIEQKQEEQMARMNEFEVKLNQFVTFGQGQNNGNNNGNLGQSNM